MHFRPVTPNDADMLLAWRNDPITRKNSRNSREIAVEEHQAWLKKKPRLYIAEQDMRPVGSIQATICENGTELSWTVAPEQRGKGLGKQMVVQFAQEIIPKETIYAVIEEGNIASEHIASALGLHKTEAENPENPRRFMIWK